MKNRQPINDFPAQPYFKGWFIALQNYEEYEIEAVKEKIASILLDEVNTYQTHGTISPDRN